MRPHELLLCKESNRSYDSSLAIIGFTTNRERLLLIGKLEGTLQEKNDISNSNNILMIRFLTKYVKMLRL